MNAKQASHTIATTKAGMAENRDRNLLWRTTARNALLQAMEVATGTELFEAIIMCEQLAQRAAIQDRKGHRKG